MLAQNFAQAYIFSVQAYIFFLLLSGEKLLSYAPVCLASSASTPSILEGELQAVLHYESREPSCSPPYTYCVPNGMQIPPLSGGPSGEERKGIAREARGWPIGPGAYDVNHKTARSKLGDSPKQTMRQPEANYETASG